MPEKISGVWGQSPQGTSQRHHSPDEPFFTAASLVNQPEEAQKRFGLDSLLKRLDRIDLLIVDELGDLSFSRTGAELLFQVFADRYERRSLLITSNLSFSDWGQIFQGDRMTAALLDRLTRTLFEWLQITHKGRFPDSTRRTFERRVNRWRSLHGPGRTVFFSQEHHPGRLATRCQSSCSR